MKIAIFGGSFNPPGLHHRQIAEEAAKIFDRVIIYPCGFRPDKETTNDVDPYHRAAMIDMTFGDLGSTVQVVLNDLEQGVFTRTHVLDKKFKVLYPNDEIFHIIGADLIENGAKGESFIQTTWENGRELWQNLNFAILTRPGYMIDQDDLPPYSQFIQLEVKGASKDIRLAAFSHKFIGGMVVKKVEDYINRYGLYTGRIPSATSRFCLDNPRFLIEHDERNERAVALAQELLPYCDNKDPNLIISIGGDGTMLHTIKKHWRRRLPFYGINLGHVGFLLNPKDTFNIELLKSLTVIGCPLLYVETCGLNKTGALAFNDAWIERFNNQAAHLQVSINGEVKIPELIGDGILACTPAGSSAYARAMGGAPMLLHNPAIQLVASNIIQPFGWKSALLSVGDEIQIQSCSDIPGKRLVKAFADGTDLGECDGMKIRTSRVATAELAFLPGYDLAEKVRNSQFPK